jgi:hypothetical protein
MYSGGRRQFSLSPLFFLKLYFLKIMKNLLITQSCLIHGNHTEAGTVLENVENPLAVDLINAGRACIMENDELHTRAPMPEHRDPKPRIKKPKVKSV